MQIIGIPIIRIIKLSDQFKTQQIRIFSSLILKVSSQMMEQCLSDEGLNLSMLQIGILRLVSHEPFTLSELSRKMLLDPSTLVPSVESLVKRGYIKKERDPNDRRRMPLSLTDEGLALLDHVHAVRHDDPLLIALQAMGQEKTQHLHDLLRDVVTHLPDGDDMLTKIQEHFALIQRKQHSENNS